MHTSRRGACDTRLCGRRVRQRPVFVLVTTGSGGRGLLLTRNACSSLLLRRGLRAHDCQEILQRDLVGAAQIHLCDHIRGNIFRKAWPESFTQVGGSDFPVFIDVNEPEEQPQLLVG